MQSNEMNPGPCFPTITEAEFSEFQRLRAVNAAWKELYDAALPFVQLVATTAGRIPTEKLSFADWHALCSAFNKCTPNRE